MIFVTVGTQVSFDRLIRAVQDWSEQSGRSDLVIQTNPGAWQPAGVDCREFIDSVEYRRLIDEAELVIAHAGMGTILSCLVAGRRLVVMPRLAELREHRNDHQVATADKMEAKGVFVARSDQELASVIEKALASPPPDAIGTQASDELIGGLQGFLDELRGDDKKPPGELQDHSRAAEKKEVSVDSVVRG